MNGGVIQERRQEFLLNEVTWAEELEKRSLSADIMSAVHSLEDHGDAVEKSEDVDRICFLMQEANDGKRSNELLSELRFHLKNITDQISGVAWQGH